jgi:predicted DsbA family dithiol-disulfide isomerase
LAHRFALQSPFLTADAVEITEFPHLAQRYHVRAVPRTVVNETGAIEGTLPEPQFLEAVLAAAREQE